MFGISPKGGIAMMINRDTYEERLSSIKTEALFIGMTLLFLILSVWRICTRGPGILSRVFLFLFIFFCFYSINYIILAIRLDSESLKLKFGIFTWTIPVDNIDHCRLDDLPVFMKYGGAGIHFMLIRGRYRASFNFLEHPRVVVALKRKAGPVRDVSFSTSRPNEVLRRLEDAIAARNAP
jgi:hypothetical protein